jgi:hypothetical protein
MKTINCATESSKVQSGADKSHEVPFMRSATRGSSHEPNSRMRPRGEKMRDTHAEPTATREYPPCTTCCRTVPGDGRRRDERRWEERRWEERGWEERRWSDGRRGETMHSREAAAERDAHLGRV